MSDGTRPFAAQRIAGHVATLAIGSALGAGAVWVVLSGWIDGAVLESLLQWAALGLLVLVPLVATVAMAALWALRRFTDRFHGSLEKVMDHGTKSLQAAAAKNADSAVEQLALGLREGVSWYAPIAARRFIVQSTLALLVAFGGLAGTALLIRQNILLKEQTDLLAKQNDKVDLQIVMAEAQRRSEITLEIFQILRDVQTYAETHQDEYRLPKYCMNEVVEFEPRPPPAAPALDLGNAEAAMAQQFMSEKPPHCSHKLLALPQALAARIRTVAQSATPYHTPEANKLENGTWEFSSLKKPLSRQRGALLTGLVGNRIDLAELRADFSYADLRKADLTQANLAFLEGEEADFSAAKLDFSDFFQAKIFNVTFSEAELQSASFKAAVMTGNVFERSNLSGSDFSGTFGVGMDFSHSNLNDIILAEIGMYEAGLLGAQLQGTKISVDQLMYRDTSVGWLSKVGERRLADIVVGGAASGEQYKLWMPKLNLAGSLDRVQWPKGWSAHPVCDFSPIGEDRVCFPIPETAVEQWSIETPWGNYRDLVAEQTEKGFIDLWAREQKMLGDRAKPN